ncbi:hypothetical protein CYY_004649 [Polysphondylium violaceum]|uniref:Uncharacterized protein n=1 Tax=Polysphondylium violaceum TaxID=133409 RepID=A0A8J4PUY8_9MYCE|nr:hypothetical protein CYY_004649 [Polysphondylium violaceum]
MSYLGKLAIITGGSRGIGLDIAKELSKRGANICILNRDKENNQKALESLDLIDPQQKHHGIIADLSNPLELKHKVEIELKEIKEQLKSNHVDYLIHCAGITHNQLLLRNSFEKIDQLLQVNLVSPIYLTKLLFKDFMKSPSSRIIFIGSIISEKGNKGQCVYAATKSGLEGFNKSLSKELPITSTCNVISPGFINTEMSKEYLTNELLNEIPLKKFGDPKDITKTVLYLIDSNYITGQVIKVDGGLH